MALCGAFGGNPLEVFIRGAQKCLRAFSKLYIRSREQPTFSERPISGSSKCRPELAADICFCFASKRRRTELNEPRNSSCPIVFSLTR
jgi:hypothetical protein